MAKRAAAASSRTTPAPTPDPRLTAALAERDAALAQVAALAAQLDALRLAAARPNEPPLPQYPVSAGIEAPPLRYVLVDRANDALRSALGPVHGVLRSLASGLSQK